MNTSVIDTQSSFHPESLIAPAETLKKGGLVVFPTETVYGLGAVFNDENALLKIFAVKGRPSDNPLIVHIWDVKQLSSLVSQVSSKAECLTKAFWPGPLTIIFPKRSLVSGVVTAGLDTVAVRMPSHPVAQALLRLTDVPVAAPSANLSGRPSPTKGSHVVEDLFGKVEYIIDAGPCPAGIESTVIKLEPDPVILRPGSVTKEMLEQALGERVAVANPDNQEHPQAPGMKYRHYAPQAPALLFEGDPEKVVAEINHRLDQGKSSERIVVISSSEHLTRYRNEWVLDLGPLESPEVAASRLYDLLRFCDQLAASQILIEGVKPQGVGLAVANRLRKAAGGCIVRVS
ncbi:L-threonylcarbamoyladenylate synthase [Hydrogenispora ethanolica]|uniref:L-threonylcarbamoyladenylate synthase n=1 Tax=Hydrogenispora ethanolica TaxID=1082276 RepID=UPI00243635EA|nr:L-threonylcarbamoyladenylate synthase [Hydrogenispora ethanolica]